MLSLNNLILSSYFKTIFTLKKFSEADLNA